MNAVILCHDFGFVGRRAWYCRAWAVIEPKKRYPDCYIIIVLSVKLSSEARIIAGISDMAIPELIVIVVDDSLVTETIEMLGAIHSLGLLSSKIES